MIQASGVNKAWYDLVAESAQMKKFKIVFKMATGQQMIDKNKRFYESSDLPDGLIQKCIQSETEKLTLNEETKDILMQSKRKYENIEITEERCARSTFYLPLILGRAGSWKSVTWKQFSLKDDNAWSEMLQAIGPTVRELSISAPVFYGGQPVNVSRMTGSQISGV